MFFDPIECHFAEHQFQSHQLVDFVRVHCEAVPDHSMPLLFLLLDVDHQQLHASHLTDYYYCKPS